jgi:6-phosphogluconolactonase
MGFTALNAGREVWMIVTGADKAPMVAMALGGAGRVQVPAAGVAGRSQTLWLLDEAAASRLPKDLRRR